MNSASVRIPIAQLIFYFYLERIDKQGLTTSGISFSQLYTIDLSTYLYIIAGESVSDTDGELQRCRRSGTASTQQSLERTAGHCSRHTGNQLKGRCHRKCKCSPSYITLALASNACNHGPPLQCVTWGGGGDQGPQTEKHLPPSTFTNQFLREADI
jgi:hypothetical protein